MKSKFQQAIETVACPKCQAAPGTGCTLKSGRPATSCHNERLRLARELLQDPSIIDERYTDNWS